MVPDQQDEASEGSSRIQAAIRAHRAEDSAALGLPRRLQNYEVGDIAEGNDEISGLRGEVVAYPVVIGEHQEVHYW